MFQTIKIILGIIAFFLVYHSAVRIIRYLYKFPMPHFMANVIDNPLRRKFQPPDETAVRHGIQPGMTVLDVGPGNGRYTLAAAKKVGESGKVYAIDIEPRMIERVQKRFDASGLLNLEARAADVYDLPFDDGYFDLVYMIAVISEIPDPKKAIQELHRVLKPAGKLVFSELFMDPDYPFPKTVEGWAAPAGFKLVEKKGNWWHYTLVFEKALN